MSDNLRIWAALEKTDPRQTKNVQRPGGQKITSTKPIYNIRRLTQLFGPAGIGWGTTEPVYTIQGGHEELLVFCVVGLWYVDDDSGRGGGRSAPVYGIGGDKITAKTKNGQVNSDEAFKAAFTDALSNAMKHIGVGADIHMGLFEDDKYVRELRREFADAEAPQQESPPPPHAPPPTPHTDDARKRLADKEAAEGIRNRLRLAQSYDEIDTTLNDPTLDYFKQGRPDIYAVLIGMAERCRENLPPF